MPKIKRLQTKVFDKIVRISLLFEPLLKKFSIREVISFYILSLLLQMSKNSFLRNTFLLKVLVFSKSSLK